MRRQDLPAIDRDLWRGLSQAVQRPNDMRDALEHGDQRLLDGEIPPDQALLMVLEADRLRSGVQTIMHFELATALAPVAPPISALPH